MAEIISPRSQRELLIGSEEYPIVQRVTNSDGSSGIERIVNSERPQQLSTYVFWDSTVSEDDQNLIKSSMYYLYRMIDIDHNAIQYYGDWKSQNTRDNRGSLVPYESTEWLINNNLDSQRNQIKAGDVVQSGFYDPYQKTYPHWEVVFTNRDLYMRDTNFVVGCALGDLGTVISFNRFNSIKDPSQRREVLQTEIFHEVGHVLGLPSSRRGLEKLNNQLGYHCVSRGCSMQQGMSVPYDWVKISEERKRFLNNKPYCEECIQDLKRKFRKT